MACLVAIFFVKISTSTIKFKSITLSSIKIMFLGRKQINKSVYVYAKKINSKSEKIETASEYFIFCIFSMKKGYPI